MVARLDSMLDRITARGADGLSLRVGEIPVVLAAGKRVPVMKAPLSGAEWRLLVLEVAGAQCESHIDRREPCEFAYRDFVFQIRFAGGAPECEARPAAAPADLPPATCPGSESAISAGESPREMPTGGELELELPEPAGPVANRGTTGDDSSRELSPDAFELDGDLEQIRRTSAHPPPLLGVPGVGLEPPVQPLTSNAAHAPARRADVSPGRVASGAPWLWFIRENAKLLATATAAVVALLAVVLWWTKPVTLPNLVMQGAEGEAVSFAEMRHGKDRLLVVFLIPGCEVSRFSLNTLKDLASTWSGKVSFVGLLFATQAEAIEYQEQNEVPFEVYGLKDARDPFALQEILKKVGESGLGGATVYGGTVMLLDEKNRLRLRLEKEEVRSLPEKLASAAK